MITTFCDPVERPLERLAGCRYSELDADMSLARCQRLFCGGKLGVAEELGKRLVVHYP